MKHKNILLIGGSGFIGSHVAAQLVAQGLRVTVLSRRRDRARELFLLPTVEVVEGDPYDAATLARNLVGQDALINLVGVLHDKPGTPYGPAFNRAHVELVKILTEACKSAGVKRFIQLSALGASSEGPSMYQRSKAAGESVVHASGLDWTIFRPSVVFGPDDRFLNMFAMLLKWLWVFPLASGATRFAPVFVGDVARAIVRSLDEEAAFGKTYELVGPRVYSLAELVRLVGEASGHVRPILPLPGTLGYLQALVMEWMPGPTLISRDNLKSMMVDNVASGNLPGLSAPELGGTNHLPEALEVVAVPHLAGIAHQHSYLDAFRVSAHR